MLTKGRQRCLCWTVEWIHDDGRRDLGECLESQPISEAYAAQFDNAEPPKKKRWKSSNNKDLPGTGDASTLPTEVATPIAPSEPLAPSAYFLAPELRPAQPPVPSELPAPTTAALASSQQSPNPPPPSIPRPTTLNFYLHLPSTPTSARVLIPLAPLSILSTSLSKRLVLEFPTIYALRNPPDQLPEGFITEEEFLKGLRRGEVRSDLKGLIEEVDDGEVVGGGLEREVQEGMDEKRLADVLRRDLG